MLKEIITHNMTNRPPKLWPKYGGGYLNRNKVVTSSEIGDCMRKVKFSKEMGADGDDGATTYLAKEWGYMERGHHVEKWVVHALGDDTQYVGDDQVSFVRGNQSGTPDGIIIDKDMLLVLEIKSFDPRTNVSKFPKENHVDQLMQNMFLVSKELGFEHVRGLLLYINASDFEDMYEFDVSYDELAASDLHYRASVIMDAESPADLPAEGMFNSGCKHCMFTAECSKIVSGNMKKETENARDKFF